jgi:hypothetical protein
VISVVSLRTPASSYPATPHRPAGFAVDSAGSPTPIDAFHRDYTIKILSEASVSRALEGVPANQFHGAVSKVSGHCCDEDENERLTAST